MGLTNSVFSPVLAGPTAGAAGWGIDLRMEGRVSRGPIFVEQASQSKLGLVWDLPGSPGGLPHFPPFFLDPFTFAHAYFVG